MFTEWVNEAANQWGRWVLLNLPSEDRAACDPKRTAHLDGQAAIDPSTNDLVVTATVRIPRR